MELPEDMLICKMELSQDNGRNFVHMPLIVEVIVVYSVWWS